MKKTVLLALLCCAASVFAEAPYTSGIFILNEDWYGHANSTLNHLSNSGAFSYRILQAANEAPASLGCTSQFAAIYGDTFYFVSKQSQDPGETSRRGARVVVADAKTLKIAYSIDTLLAINGKHAADGRGFVGVDETKGYIGSSNGIFVLDFATGKITRRIQGTENSLITGGENNTDGTGVLYQNQIGMMLRTHDYVFAIQQDTGIHVIDPVADTIITTIRGCFSTMAQSKDGRIWAARNTNAEAQTYPYGAMSGESWQGNELLAINPATLATTAYDLRTLSGNDDMIVEQTWYAWTAGSLSSSLRENALFFSYTDNIWDWYNGRVHIMKFDIDNLSVTEIYTTSGLGDYYIYNSGMVRVNPLTGNLFVGCFKGTVSGNEWLFLQITPTGQLVRTYAPIKYYWYPALFVFPDSYAPQVQDFTPQTLGVGQTVAIPLGAIATDQDNLSAAITKRVLSVSDSASLVAKVARDTLWLTGIVETLSPVQVVVRFNSNGKTVDKTLSATVENGTTAVENTSSIAVRAQGGEVLVSGIVSPATVTVYDMLGHIVYTATTATDVRIPLPQGLYVVRVGGETIGKFVNL